MTRPLTPEQADVLERVFAPIAADVLLRLAAEAEERELAEPADCEIEEAAFDALTDDPTRDEFGELKEECAA